MPTYPVQAIALALSLNPATVPIPEGMDATSWVFAECRAVDASNTELGLSYPDSWHEGFQTWNSRFFEIAQLEYDRYEITSVGQARVQARGFVTRQIILGELTAENWHERMDSCALSYEVMTRVLVENESSEGQGEETNLPRK